MVIFYSRFWTILLTDTFTFRLYFHPQSWTRFWPSDFILFKKGPFQWILTDLCISLLMSVNLWLLSGVSTTRWQTTSAGSERGATSRTPKTTPWCSPLMSRWPAGTWGGTLSIRWDRVLKRGLSLCRRDRGQRRASVCCESARLWTAMSHVSRGGFNWQRNPFLPFYLPHWWSNSYFTND